MKIFRSELAQNYDTYSFGYSIYAIREKKDKLADIYKKGFLPYSGKDDVRDHLYMSRSVRVSLEEFTTNSENRRVLRKFEGVFHREVVPIKKFDIKNKQFLSFCKTYFKEWHGIDIEGKLTNILNSGFVTNVVVYTKKNKVLAYVLLVQDKIMSHYWFSFYDMSLIRKSFGMWLMINEVIEAKRARRAYMYVGTGYGDKAKYKMNFDNIEYWDGSRWIGEKNSLSKRVKTDDSRTIHFSDEWKS